jgi:uncharacterized protein (UPF0276 family)
MFDPQKFACMGVGLEYHANQNKPRTEPLRLSPLFDYLEIQPPHLLQDPGLIEAMGDTRALLHSSSLSLGSVGMPMEPELLEWTCTLLHQLRKPWFGEHISWTRFPGGNTRHFVLPYLGDAVRDTVIANARALHQKTGLPVLLENAPRTLILDMPGDASEADFMRDVVDGADAGFILDIDNARATAKAKGQHLRRYIDSLPLDRTVEIHVHNPLVDRDLLWQVLGDAPVRAVTLGWGTRELNYPVLIETVQALKARIREKASRGVDALERPARPHAGATG